MLLLSVLTNFRFVRIKELHNKDSESISLLPVAFWYKVKNTNIPLPPAAAVVLSQVYADNFRTTVTTQDNSCLAGSPHPTQSWTFSGPLTNICQRKKGISWEDIFWHAALNPVITYFENNHFMFEVVLEITEDTAKVMFLVWTCVPLRS